ncbi:MAG: UPF0182 family protein [Dehalococcoidia bacterium]|nr:UPF0182 family protein [Dehalococcoidia bacterium]
MGFPGNRGGGDNLGPPPDIFRIGGEGLSQTRFRGLGALAAMFLLALVLNVTKSLYVDWLWFDSVGPNGDSSYLTIFQTVLAMRVMLFFGGALTAALVIGGSVSLARRLAPPTLDEESFIEEVDPQAIRRLVSVALIAATLLLSIVFGATASGAWERLLAWYYAAPFGVADPAFHRDVSFYVFELPAYQFVHGWALALFFVATLASAAVYGLAIALQRFEMVITAAMRIHLSIMVGFIIVLVAVGTWLSTFGLTLSGSGAVFGATYTDINARLPVRYILAGVGLFAGLATIANGFISSSFRLPTFLLGVWGVVAVVGGAIYPQLVQSLQVSPNELEKETPFIARNIEATRRAWALDAVEETTFPALPAVTLDQVRANPETIDNIRLLDPRPLRETVNQVQSIRPLYIFNDVDIDRYRIGNRLRSVMISARELDISRVQSPVWTRERLQLTHGFGAIVAPVNEVSTEGLPNLLTKDIPPVGTDVPISVDGARIYFGELTRHYVVVNTNVDEFDYPVGTGNATTTYAADRGIRLGSVGRRTALAWQLADINLLVSGQLGPGSRVLMHRKISERIAFIAPFLTLDHDPYLITLDGHLLWVQDAYTATGNYPYSQRQGDINYLRNSVKVTVDAVTGDTVFYQMEDEPLVNTWGRIFPDLFTPASQMPPGLREHIRYPEDLFRQQSLQYLRYHITDPKVFFVGEDLWAIPTERFGGQQEQQVEPYYVVMRLPGESREEFALILPFTPRNKQNTVAWLAGRSDGDHYGKLRTFRFPTDDLVFGPAQVEARIDQNPGISQQLSLWNQSGSSVIRGNLLMIPIGDSFLFVEPIYLQAQNSRLPELKRVVVANGNTIAMEETFRRSLDVVFGLATSSLPGGGTPPAAPPGAPGTGPEATPTPARPASTAPAGSLQELLDAARAASGAAQSDLDRLHAILDEIERQQGAPRPTATPAAPAAPTAGTPAPIR